MNNKNMNGMLTVKQVADRLHVNKETVYRWLRTGKLAGSKLGDKLWRITDDSLADFLSHRTGAKSEHAKPSD